MAERVLCVRAAAPRADGADGGAVADVARLAQVQGEEQPARGRSSRVQVGSISILLCAYFKVE